ncbi:MAG TPA: hypothetical protein VLE69_00760 [Candidatus Saccharimonadales bacterium]|nr:hypothetical protein [Candidatus Saccharimonadales bacterium]
MIMWLPAEIPLKYWSDIVETEYEEDDVAETKELLSQPPGPSVVRVLGDTGLVLATQIRLHDFGDLEVGSAKIEAVKTHPGWLGLEAACIKENLETADFIIQKFIGQTVVT